MLELAKNTMVEIRIHGRGGQGGVTLAKLIATSRFLQGQSVQAFGLYAAERSGAPIQAFCRYADDAINNRNLIYEPDHVIVLDPTLVGPGITGGLKPGGWILINTPASPDTFQEQFSNNRLATVDATSIARRNKLGTRTVPIVNTALAGAAVRMLEFDLEEMQAAIEHLGFTGSNLTAAKEAYDQLRTSEPAELSSVTRSKSVSSTGLYHADEERGPSFVEGAGGGLPGIETGLWATEQPHRQQFVPPCNHVCPAGNDVQGFLQALANDDVDNALAIIVRTSPFPSICGRVCPAPCMASCNRIELDGAVNVRQLERYAGDHGRAKAEPLTERDEHVAVVGSGPAGLTAAYHLARLGYYVTIYEQGWEIGGLLRTGIPGYRLPADVLDREIGRILSLGVDVEFGEPIDRNRMLELAQNHDAVLVATGLQELQALRLGVGDAEAVEQGIDFLDRSHHGEVRVDGEHVVVVGGGNTAMDAARSALRLGATSSRVIYRRTRHEMPAIEEEIEEALEEGVVIDFLIQPITLQLNEHDASNEGQHRVVCRHMELGEPDESGRRRPVEVAESDFEIGCDRVILALGQSPDLSVFPEGTEVRQGQKLLGLLETPVYAIGDFATRDGTVAGAIGSGRRSAFHIHNTLNDIDVPVTRQNESSGNVEVWRDEVIQSESLKLHLFERRLPSKGVAVTPEARRATFDEVHAGLTDPREAKRCLSCGVCNECDLCVTFCPEGVLKRVGHDLVFDYAHCKGCGICVTECPRNVVFMSHL
jgi:2-oxoacid:acceptor oxidoreductase gamma subunit (pyruvate/2-ketoisovalerate family)